ncbi:hypothetical protein CYMTET_35449 [Cymbomonas tetramitiformis]|uniref:peptidylprolyl isomerase n=1 Tax=Cymbomonas tetramitiformis TaxID=36881 RepID=A0AAE0F9H4_9CHLO|nr:hypothetical protein CYMTET_35449 [Cymbomonas tetramitiformis]
MTSSALPSYAAPANLHLLRRPRRPCAQTCKRTPKTQHKTCQPSRLSKNGLSTLPLALRHVGRGNVSVPVVVAANSKGSTDASSAVTTIPEDAERRQSGLVSKVLTPGAEGGTRPGPNDTVIVNYSGWRMEDGILFDSTLTAGGEPCSFATGAIIPGWTEALQLMTVGEKRRIWLPSRLAYGDAPTGGQPAGDLVFDLELVGVEPPLPPKMKMMTPKNRSKKFTSPWSFLDNLIP